MQQGFRSLKKQRGNRNQRCRNKINLRNFRLQNKEMFSKSVEKKDRVLDSILSRLSQIEERLGLQLKSEG